jgi:hypothetical protein
MDGRLQNASLQTLFIVYFCVSAKVKEKKEKKVLLPASVSKSHTVWKFICFVVSSKCVPDGGRGNSGGNCLLDSTTIMFSPDLFAIKSYTKNIYRLFQWVWVLV